MVVEKRRIMLYFTGLFCGLIPLANLLNLLINLTLGIEPKNQIDVNVNLSVALLFVSVCVIPAVVEEILFRGLIQRFLMRFGAVKAIIITSLIFSSLHMNGMVSIFILSLALSVAMWLFRSLKFVIVLHLINNCFSYILYLISYYLGENNAFVMGITLHVLLLLFSFITAILGRKRCQNQMIIIWKRRSNSPKRL